MKPGVSILALLLCAISTFRVDGQATNGAWVYPSATGNLLYQLDSRGQRIADFSQCGYRGGTEPLPNVTAIIAPDRWVDVSPGTGDDTARIQAAIDSVEALTPDANGWRGVVELNAGEYQLATTLTINASGVVLKGAGDSTTSGTRLRATDPRQYTLISVSGSGSRSTVSGTTRNLTQKLVPAGTRTFEVDSTSGLAVGHTVIVKRPSTANWIADIDMDQLGPSPVVPWTAGSKDLNFDRIITRIDGNWVTVDVPLPQTFELSYGGGQIWRYTWSGRIQQVGIQDLYGFSDYASSTDEAHAWKFIQINNAQHIWVRNITAQYFGYSAVSVGDGAKWLTVADSQCLDPISEITGGRRYSFNNEGAECALFLNNYARKGRHDFVFGATVAGPNAFVHCTADTVYSDTGPHHRWSVGGLFDGVTINGNEINVRNRGNSGTGHGWAGAYMAVWNCKASSFSVRNPPTARNWLVGSIGTIDSSSGFAVGADPAGTYDSSGPTGTGKAVHPRSLYYGQLQQRMKWPGSEFREVWLGDVDQLASTTFGDPLNCDATWLAQVEALDELPAFAKSDYLAGSRYIAGTLDFPIDPGDTIVAASLTVSLRGIGSADTDNIWLDNTTSPQSFASLGWTPVSTTAQTVRTMEVSPALLADGRLNLAIGTNTAVDFATLHLQVQKSQPSTEIVTLNPVADAYAMGGVNAGTNYGTATTLITKDDSNADFDRETFLRWDLSGISGKIVQAKVRLAGTTANQAGNETCATFVSNDAWDENTINFNNKPTSGKLFAQWVPATGQPVEFTVTPQVLDTLLGDGQLSISILATDNYGSNGFVNYASRENATIANRPQLILTIDPNGIRTKAATGSVLNSGSAWTGGIVPENPDTAAWNATSLTGTMTLGADLNWGGIDVNDPAGPLTLNGSQSLSLGTAGIDMSTATANLTLNHPVILAENQTWDVGPGRILTATGQISGQRNLTKTGTGNMILSGANTYTGTTTISSGTLSLGNVNALGTSPGLNGTSGIQMSAGCILGANTAAGSNTTIATPITLSAAGNINLILGTGAASTTTTFTLNGTIGGSTSNLIFTTGTGSFNNGPSVFVLGAACTYSGNSRITTGNGGNNPVHVRNGIANALPADTVLSFDQVAGGGTGRTFQYDLNGFDQTLAGLDNGGVVPNLRRIIVNSPTAATLTIDNTSNFTFGGANLTTGSTNRAQITGAIALTKSGPGVFTLGGTLSGGATAGGHTFSGATRVLEGILVLGDTHSIQNSSCDTANSIAGNATNGLRTSVTALTLGGLSGNKNFSNVFTTTAGGYSGLTALTLNPGTGVTNSYAADIGDGATGMNFIKTGLGTQILTGTNTHTGATTISGGTLQLGAGGNTGALAATTAITNNGNLTVNRSNGFTQAADLNGQAITGSGSFTQIGAGTTTLSAANTHAGATTVSGGTLVLSGSLAGPLSVNNGTFAPQGTPTTGSALTLNAGGTFQARILGSSAGSSYDQLAAGGSVTLGGPLDLVSGPGLAPGSSFTIVNKTSSGAIVGTFAGKPEGSAFTEDGYTWIISYLGGDGNDVVLTLATPAQAWRFAWFGTISNSGTAADNFDADNDGEMNLLEYATAQNPTAATRFNLSVIRTPSDLEISYTRNKAAVTGGVTFTIEWSDMLAPGSWSAGDVTQTILSDDGILQSVKATIPSGQAIPTRFTRLKVTSP